MSAIALVLGVVAYLIFRSRHAHHPVGVAENAVALTVGVAALIFAEAEAAELLLGLFMGSILVVLVLELADHTARVPAPTGAHASRVRRSRSAPLT